MTAAGFIYPGVGAEADYPLAETLLGGGVSLPVHNTGAGDVVHEVGALIDVGTPDDLGRHARALLTRYPDVQSIVWACTSGSFVYGWSGAPQQVRTITDATGLPASSTSLAFVHAAKALGLTRVGLAASYPEPVVAHFAQFLADGGLEVVSVCAGEIPSAAGAAALGRQQVLDFAASADSPEAEAVLVPDTAMHSIAWLPELEEAIGKPVLTANQVSIWEGLRLSGGPVPASSRLGVLFGAGELG